MASSFTNVGLADLARGMLGATPPPTSTPRTTNLIGQLFEPGPTLTYPQLAWASNSFPIMLPGLWQFALQAGANLLVASASVLWPFTAADAGLVFFGVGIYDPVSLELFYTETFPAPYVVPATGGTLPWNFFFNLGDCQQLG